MSHTAVDPLASLNGAYLSARQLPDGPIAYRIDVAKAVGDRSFYVIRVFTPDGGELLAAYDTLVELVHQLDADLKAERKARDEAVDKGARLFRLATEDRDNAVEEVKRLTLEAMNCHLCDDRDKLKRELDEARSIANGRLAIIGGMEADAETLREGMEGFAAKVNDLTEELTTTRAGRDELKNKLSKVSRHRDELIERLSTADEVASLAADRWVRISRLNHENSDLNHEVSELKAALEETRKGYGLVVAERDRLKAERDQLARSFDAFPAILGPIERESDELRARVAELTAKPPLLKVDPDDLSKAEAKPHEITGTAIELRRQDLREYLGLPADADFELDLRVRRKRSDPMSG